MPATLAPTPGNSIKNHVSNEMRMFLSVRQVPIISLHLRKIMGLGILDEIQYGSL